MIEINDEMIETVAVLSQLELGEEEWEQTRQDMVKMLGYFAGINALDTSGIEPMTHLFPVDNVFREDEINDYSDREGLLKNAPEAKNGMLCAPKSF